MTDCKNLELAREWAADIDADRETLSQDTIDAAADLISSLPDEWVDADDLRKYISDWREGLAKAPRGNYEAEMLDDLEDMLPAPPAPEAVAELVRLRKELEALLRACIESAEVSERKAEVSQVPGIYVGVAEAERNTADIITRILEGHTDE